MANADERDDLPTAEDWANINFHGASACSFDPTADDDDNEEEDPESSSNLPVDASDVLSQDPSEDPLADLEDPLADSELATALERISELEDQLARAKADHYNLNTEYGNYVRRAKEAIPGYKSAGHIDVLEALIGVLDDIDAARKAGDLEDGPFAAIATKLEETLESKFSMTRFGTEGDDFDPNVHEALMARPNPEVDHEVIGQVLQPGYMMGERILRVAKVLVDNPS